MKAALTFVLVIVFTGCAHNHDLLPSTEYVLTKGMKIVANTPNGRVEIVAGNGTERIFSGDGWSKRRWLIPRTTRWYGSLGLYDPAASYSPCGRLLADEGRLFFESESEALRYLYKGSGSSRPIFNSRGLVIGFYVVPFPGGEPTRNVTVWQIYIKGKRPQSLRGAEDDAISVEGGEIPDTATPNPAPIGYPVTFGDREYVPTNR
jgi:hypothetical protein